MSVKLPTNISTRSSPSYTIPLVLQICRLSKLGVTYSGALKEDATGAHSFIFLKRKGWSFNLLILQWKCLCEFFNSSRPKTLSFSIMCPSHWAADVPSFMRIEQHGPAVAAESPEDVIVVVKRFMSDQDLMQAWGQRSPMSHDSHEVT